MSDSLEVWLDADFLPERIQVGTLAHDRMVASAATSRHDPAKSRGRFR
jgi:hypothetical protein